MAARKTRSTRSAKGKKAAAKAPPKRVPIPYEHAGDYRQFCSTGSLVRSERNSIVITFYIDEMSPTQQVANLVSAHEHGGSYELGEIEERARRLVVASVRIDPEQAASLAGLIADKCYSIRPDLFPDAPGAGGDIEK